MFTYLPLPYPLLPDHNKPYGFCGRQAPCLLTLFAVSFRVDSLCWGGGDYSFVLTEQASLCVYMCVCVRVCVPLCVCVCVCVRERERERERERDQTLFLNSEDIL